MITYEIIILLNKKGMLDINLILSIMYVVLIYSLQRIVILGQGMFIVAQSKMAEFTP